MASIAFLLAPSTPLRDETDRVWLHDAKTWARDFQSHWTRLVDRLPADQRARVPRYLRSRMAYATLHLGVGSPPNVLSRNALKAAQALLADFVAGGFAGPLPVVDALFASQAVGLAPAPGLDSLIDYRGGMRAVPPTKLKRGGSLCYVSNAGSPWEFNVFRFGAGERSALHALACAHGGDFVTVVTWGESLMVERISSPGPGVRPTVDDLWAVRVVPLVAGGRDPGHLDRLRRLFEGAAIRPDFDAIERELAAPRMSVPAFFNAFGIPGARELQPPDAGALWAQLDEVAAALLAGAPAPKPALAAVNAVLAESGERLPGKPARPGKGATASKVTDARHELAERLPAPDGGPWAERLYAADTVERVESSAAYRTMTFGRDSKGMGDAAATARMLLHVEPASRAGDPIAIALLAQQCEAWNWHGFVEPLAKLAETLGQTSFTAIVAPSGERASLRDAFGIEAPEEHEADIPPGPWTAEVFLDSPALVKGDLGAAAAAWMRKRKSTGAVARVAPDGSVSIAYFAAGVAVPAAADAGLPAADVAALRNARLAFDLRAVPAALGVGDLFAPGDLTPSSRAAAPTKHSSRAAADGLLETLPKPSPVPDWRILTDRFDGELRLRAFDGSQGDPLLALRIRVPGGDPEGLRSLRNDLTGEDLADAGEVWSHDATELRADMGDDYYPEMLRMVLGDAPRGTELTLSGGRFPPLSAVLSASGPASSAEAIARA